MNGIRFQVGDVDYVLRFNYVVRPVTQLQQFGQLPRSFRCLDGEIADTALRHCTLVKLMMPANGRENGRVVASGISICSPLDAFQKTVGRRLAIANMIHNNRHNRRPNDPFNITRDFSQQMWKAYFASTKQNFTPCEKLHG